MTCVKTGCHIFIVHYGIYAYGDAHQVGANGPYFFRLVEQSDMPMRDVLHYEVDNHDSWWDKRAMEEGFGSSTLVVPFENVTSYGYDGREINTYPDFPKGVQQEKDR